METIKPLYAIPLILAFLLQVSKNIPDPVRLQFVSWGRPVQADHHPTILMDEFAARASVLFPFVPESAEELSEFVPSKILRSCLSASRLIFFVDSSPRPSPTSATELKVPQTSTAVQPNLVAQGGLPTPLASCEPAASFTL